ncbi:UDP-glucose 4-epimerase family protein [Flavobacterium sp. W21_SRS_FM6]|uniref:UDP-glucose 4-epimerase family protein n=1 Tax=Flavobacterium sp. W21_SRS_FM6 TaxID=3240268 RepID=UPI003F929182
MTKILVTGGSGFVGQALLSRLSTQYSIVAPVRRPLSCALNNVVYPIINGLVDLIENDGFFSDCDVIVHVAAKAHVMGVSLSEFRQLNSETTLRLATTAAINGVKRFIFLSSIGVNGISNTRPFNVADKPGPVEDYAVSKLEAEVGLKQIAAETGMEVVILRPPLVYGPNAPGNFGKLANLVRKNLPLPLGAIHNKRSLVGIDNLVDLIFTCIDHPAAANQTYLVSDDHDVSTTELLKTMTRAAGKQPWLLPVPMSWLKFAGKITGRESVIDRLCGNLQVDITHTKNTLGWKPVVSFQEGIEKCFVEEKV